MNVNDRVDLWSIVTDKAISFEFQLLSPEHLKQSCSITLDVNSAGKWEG